MIGRLNSFSITTALTFALTSKAIKLAPNNAKKNGSKKGLSTKEIAIRLSARQEPAASATSLGPNLLIRGPTVGSAQTEPTP